MQHVIVRIGRPIVHGEGRYGESAGRIVIQDMLSEGSGEHALWSPDGGGKNHLPSGGDPEGRVYGWYWRGEAPSPVRHILMSWRWLTLVFVRFCLYSVPCDGDGPAGSARWPLSRLGFHSVQGW